MTAEKLYTQEEAATLLSIAPKTLGDWLRSGKIVGTKIGRKWMITETDLEDFIKKGRVIRQEEPKEEGHGK
ncbi:hypothetical protein SDC9_91886 [bioreactor metagenome]|uniref:Helix-turn-helix domain-containing protein n=1 Tax=bioreactor metagenome TaxID=1076179 RepID=A0A644ZW47_9ZZZZ